MDKQISNGVDEKEMVPEKFKDIVEKIEKLNVVDLSELVKTLEKRFGVTAGMPMMAMPATGGTAAGEDAGGAEEKTSFKVDLKAVGDNKIQVIKAVKDLLGIGLKEAKDFVDAAPKTVKDGVKKEEADEIKKKLEEAGAVVEIK